MILTQHRGRRFRAENLIVLSLDDSWTYRGIFNTQTRSFKLFSPIQMDARDRHDLYDFSPMHYLKVIGETEEELLSACKRLGIDQGSVRQLLRQSAEMLAEKADREPFKGESPSVSTDLESWGLFS